MPSLKTLREAAGLSQERLAELAGTSQPQIYKMEQNQRKMTLDWAVRLGSALGIDPGELMEDARGFGVAAKPTPHKTPPASAPELSRSMPVRAVARGGRDQEMFLEDGPIDWIPKPTYLQSARNPYAVYVVGESMMPRFRPAQLLHINPHKPPTPGAGVVVAKHGNVVLIKEFVRRTPEGVWLREYQPVDREFSVINEELEAVHTVVGLQEA